MGSIQALQMFRSCTASLSSRTLAQSVASPSRPACRQMALVMGAGARRYYSEEKISPTPSGTESANEEASLQAGPSPESELLKKLEAKEAEVVDLTGRLRYLQADFLNLQRNAAREKEQQRDFAITRFASDLLETADVLALALKSIPPTALNHEGEASLTPPIGETTVPPPSAPEPAPKSASVHLTELYHGVEITQRQLMQTLFKYHVKPFDPTGDVFDPNKHEALYQAPVAGKKSGTVIDCQKTGYMIKDRILRAAQVGVAQ